MTRLQWIFAGATAGAAGALAIALVTAPTSAPTTAIAPAPAPSPVVVATPAPVPVAEIAAAPQRVVAPVRPAAPAPGIVPGSAGMVIGIDPETGEAGMPTPEQISEMKLDESSLTSRDEGGILVQHPNGMVSLDLQGRNQDYAVIRKDKNGKNVIGCIQHPDALEHVHLAPSELEEE